MGRFNLATGSGQDHLGDKAMARTPTQFRLQKTLKEGLRRCVYRRWEATAKGTVLITKTTDLERMYRGNTPYPVFNPEIRKYIFRTKELCWNKLRQLYAARLRLGYRSLLR